MPNLIFSYISHLRKRRAPQKDLARTTHHTTTIATMARLGDKILTATATIITAGYLFFATQTPSAHNTAHAAISILFLPFIWHWRSRPKLSSAGFVTLLGAWAAVWCHALPENMGITPWAVLAPMAVYAPARYLPQRNWGRIILLLTLAGSFVSPAIWRLDSHLLLHYREGMELVLAIGFHWALLGCVYAVGARYFLADQARETAYQTAREEEKLLIARELHDVLAHSLTLIKVQAQAGLYGGDQREALEEIRNAAATSLEEVRGIVQALRDPAQSGAMQPLCQLADLAEIIASFERAGLNISARLPQHCPPVPTLVQLAGVRIVSEALTNVVKHQGVGSTVQLSVQVDEQLQITVDSQTMAPTGASTSPGSGLLGLNERATALGGRFSAQGTASDFHVCATIPMHQGDH